MRYRHYVSHLVQTSTERQRYFYIAIGLLIVVIFQSLFILNNPHSERTVIVPAQLSQSFWVDEHGVSASYLTEMARLITGTVLTVTPENVKEQEMALLRFAHPRHRGDLQHHWQTWATRIEQERVSHVFLPLQVDVSARELTAMVEGELITFVGNDQLQRTQATYRLQFIYHNGRLWLSALDTVEKQGESNA